jgi:hypothetical protein
VHKKPEGGEWNPRDENSKSTESPRLCGKILQHQDQANAVAYASLESRHVAIHGQRCGVDAGGSTSDGDVGV